MSPLKAFFEVVHVSSRSKARVGRIHTAHGIIDTPTFVPVATNATLKAVDIGHEGIKSAGIQLLFCNTYHLLLHPGPDTIASAGGLHKYVNYNGPIITDSGGFQVFSLDRPKDTHTDELKGRTNRKYDGTVLRVTEEGVHFRSYIDGRTFLLTPESTVAAQKAYGSDIIIPLDELPPYSVSRAKLEASLERTHRWEERSLKAHLASPGYQTMYSVLHGGVDRELRKKSVDFLTALPFDGHAVGGSVGKDRKEVADLLSFLMPLLPASKPVHLLGIGDEESMDACIPHGVDSFDSSYPTRLGRHGTLLAQSGPVDAKDVSYLSAHDRPIDPTCQCYVCRNYSLAYVHHLYKSREQAAHILGTIHNIHYMSKKMTRVRDLIIENKL